MTTTTNGHHTGIAGSTHIFNQRTPASTAYDLGWNHARSMLLAQFQATIESARRMQRVGPEPEFHAGLAAGLEQAIATLADPAPDAPAEGEIFIVGLEDDEDFSGIAGCTTHEQAVAWVRFLNTLPTGEAVPVIGKVRLDPPVPALARTEQIYSACLKLADGDPTDVVYISELGQLWHADSLWFGVREQHDAFFVNGLFAETKEAAEEQAIRAVRAWLANRPAAGEPSAPQAK